MATEKSTQQPSHSPAGVGMSQPMNERADVAMRATWEIEALMNTIISQEPDDMNGILVRGLAIRAKQLNSAAMAALSDESHDIAELREVVFGVQVAA
jgi:hypothetical protein